MGWSNQYHKQQQAQQLRAIERNTAAAAGVQPRKLSAIERMNGVKDPKFPPPPLPQPAQYGGPDAARIAHLEARVAALEGNLQWAIGAIQELRGTPPNAGH